MYGFRKFTAPNNMESDDNMSDNIPNSPFRDYIISLRDGLDFLNEHWTFNALVDHVKSSIDYALHRFPEETDETLRAEIDEMHSRMGAVICAATNGMMTKSNYTVDAMIPVINDTIQASYDEGYEDAKKDFGISDAA